MAVFAEANRDVLEQLDPQIQFELVMPLKLALNMGILGVSREGCLLVQGVLLLFFTESCIVTAHV